jgi:hypothetical protein
MKFGVRHLLICFLDGVGTVMDRIGSCVGIHPSQMRVVGVEEGSTIFTMTIEPEEETAGSEESKSDLLGYVSTLKTALEEDTLDLEWEIESCEITEAFNDVENTEETEATYEISGALDLVVVDEEGEVDIANTLFLCFIIAGCVAFVIIALFIARRCYQKRKAKRIANPSDKK